MVLENWQGEYKCPNDLHLIVESVYELAVLQYLIQISHGCTSVHPSLDSLCLGIFSKPVAQEAVNGLCEKGYIQRIKRPLPKANEYIINDVDINLAISNRSIAKKKAPMTREAKKGLTIKLASEFPESAMYGIGKSQKINEHTEL